MRSVAAGTMPEEEHRSDRLWRPPSRTGQGFRRHMNCSPKVNRAFRQFVRYRRRPLQAQGVGIGENHQGIEINGTQFITEVAETVAEERPCGGGLAAARFCSEQVGLALPFDGRGMQEE